MVGSLIDVNGNIRLLKWRAGCESCVERRYIWGTNIFRPKLHAVFIVKIKGIYIYIYIYIVPFQVEYYMRKLDTCGVKF